MMDNEVDFLEGCKIGVLAGGSSSERQISLKSGKAVFKALKAAGLETVFLDVNESNFSSCVEKSGIDVAFIALHGKFGEDGTVQCMLEEREIAYSGTGPESSRLALDKIASKKKFSEKGVSSPSYTVVDPAVPVSVDGKSFPCVVKPVFEGSSFGLSIVESENDLQRAVDKAAGYGEDIIIEEFIPGREMTVAILDEKALPVVEIVPVAGIYDFDAKYESSATEYLVPANIFGEEYRRVQKEALKAHNALSCEGFSRVDLRYALDGGIFVLEVNTIPGLTERSLLPMAAKAAGIDFQELCIKILKSALRGCHPWQK